MTTKPDPEGMNGVRADWAHEALSAFRKACRGDAENAVADLICNLGHWCDRNGFDFEHEIRSGFGMYEEETDPRTCPDRAEPEDGA